jgi:hypothetical protein
MNDPGTDGAPSDTVAAMDVLVPGVGELIGGRCGGGGGGGAGGGGIGRDGRG